MHGRVKVRTTAEQEELKKKERAKKVVQYKTATTLIFQKRKDKAWDNELLSVTERMVLQNPDFYTLWNIRRETLENNTWSEESYADLLQKELALIENCLRENPKSYCVWHQRWWVMEHMPKPNWQIELSLCTKCLNIDDRNFHCWDYRKYVVEKAEISDDEQFVFSITKILNNLSNYSSWHYRSIILSKVFRDDSGELPIVYKKYEEELALVMNATFTDPDDSSAWFYQRWLLDNIKPICTLWRARITKDTVTLVFNTEISWQPDIIFLFIDGKKIDTDWKSYKENKFDKIWTMTFCNPLQNLDTMKEIYIEILENKYQLYYSCIEYAWFYKANLVTRKEPHNEEQLNEQLQSYKKLFKMEPNNKWALLTGIILMKKINFSKFYEVILEDLNSLSKIDFLRSNYYKDLRSKYILEHTLESIWQKEDILEIQTKTDLSGLNLTTLYNNQYFRFFEEVNLSANQLGKSLHQLSSLQECKKLSLSSNELKSLKTFPILSNLEFLSLRNNELSDIEDIIALIKNHNLSKIDLRDNPVYEVSDILVTIKNISPKLKLIGANDEEKES